MKTVITESICITLNQNRAIDSDLINMTILIAHIFRESV